MAQTELDVAYVARLARLRLTTEETALFQEQLGHVLEHVTKLREVDVSGVEAAAHAVPIFNVFRDDEAREWFTAEEASRTRRGRRTGSSWSRKLWNESARSAGANHRRASSFAPETRGLAAGGRADVARSHRRSG